jgi:prenyltransferase beta subunit
MLQVARLAPTLLGDARDLVHAFLQSRLNPDGGFQNRSGESDLYYTVFGLEGLCALSAPPPPATVAYLETFADAASLDFVHLTCLARAWATARPEGAPPDIVSALAQRLDRFRAADGGYATDPGAARGTVYACFLGLGAAQDLRADVPHPEGLITCLDGLRAADGGFANHQGSEDGSTPATAAAVLLLRHVDRPPDARLADWLLARCHRDGGFFAAPRAPVPDLLSTATALHALVAMHASIDHIREPCLDFVDTLWTRDGGFYGSWADSTLDCEYTYYGLLALGHLSL